MKLVAGLKLGLSNTTESPTVPMTTQPGAVIASAASTPQLGQHICRVISGAGGGCFDAHASTFHVAAFAMPIPCKLFTQANADIPCSQGASQLLT